MREISFFFKRSDYVFNILLAKTKGKIETIREHTDELLKRYDRLKELYPNILTNKEWKLLHLACCYHDVGKANTKFQNKIRKKNEQIDDSLAHLQEVPHNYLSCAYMPIRELRKNLSNLELKSLLRAVYYHHDRDPEVIETSKQIIYKDLIQYIPALKKQGFNIRNEAKLDFKRFVEKNNMSEEELYLFVKLKGLLNKLDYAASAHVEAELPHDDLTSKLNSFFYQNSFKPNDLQRYLIEHRDQNHIIVASTGIGKTEGALFWIGNSKGIFTLPLKVSINAIFDRINRKFNYKSVGLLHSDTLSEYLSRNEDEQYNLALLTQTRQLSFPLTVCTIDQIIDFVALYPGFEMKLAVLSYSKLVIDEIQMYSPSLAALIVLGLKHITNVGGKFMIMTATFPPILSETMAKLGIPFKQKIEPFLKLDTSGKVIARHFMEVRENNIQVEDVIQEGLNKKILIIVNTVNKAQDLYKQFSDLGISAEVLHSRFILLDRKQKEAKIEKLGKNSCKETGIWVTTQVVEASIDIDFDILFTELSEASGLFQRMGRVFRNRTYPFSKPNIFVYTGDPLPSGISATSKKSVVDYSIYNKSKEVLKQYNYRLISEKDKMDIVEQIYTRENLKGSKYLIEFDKAILTYSNLLAYEMKDKPVLRDIENINIIPLSIYQKYEDEIQKLQETLSSNCDWTEKMNAITKLKDFIVAIPKWAYEKAKRENLIGHFVTGGKHQTYAVVKFLYTKEDGLTYNIDEDKMFM